MSSLFFFREEISARISVLCWCAPSSPFLTSPIYLSSGPWEQGMPCASTLPHVPVHLSCVPHLLLQPKCHHPLSDPRYFWHLRYTIMLCAQEKIQMLLRNLQLVIRYQMCPIAEIQNWNLNQWNESYLWNSLQGMGGAVLKWWRCRDSVPWVRQECHIWGSTDIKLSVVIRTWEN